MRDEYDALFGGIGKPEVFLYGSHYLAGALNEKPLVALRDDLAALGLTRDAAMAETEDHIAYLCEVMRYLIAGDDLAVSNLASQQRVLRAHLQPWAAPCASGRGAPGAPTSIARWPLFARDFVEVEAQALRHARQLSRAARTLPRAARLLRRSP